MLELSSLARRYGRWALPLFWAAVVLALFMALTPQPPRLIDGASDKFWHMLAFGTLTALAVAAYPRAPLLTIGERLSFMGAMIEVLQSIPALHRDCDIMDWLADTGMIAAVLLTIHALRTRPEPEEELAAEQRSCRRVAVARAAALGVGRSFQGLELVNISEGGALCRMPQPPLPGTRAELLVMGNHVAATVVWSAGGRFGVAFDRSAGRRVVERLRPRLATAA